MQPERPDAERPERALVFGHPVDVGQRLPLPPRVDRRLDWRLVAVAEDLDAPRSVARQLAAGDDKAPLGEVFELAFASRAILGGDVQPRLPAAHAASMKLSRTFLGPAFSNSISSLLPSTATMRP